MMNERIKELLHKAISDVDYIRDDDSINDELSMMYIPDCFAERFTELIVEECATIVCGFELLEEVSDGEYMEYEASAALKKHFGVK